MTEHDIPGSLDQLETQIHGLADFAAEQEPGGRIHNPETDGEVPDDIGTKMERIKGALDEEIINSKDRAEGDDFILPADIRAKLAKSLPKAAVKEILSETAHLDKDGNVVVGRQFASHIQAFVVDYLAMGIFGDRMSTHVLEHQIISEKEISIRDPETNKSGTYLMVSAKAKVRVEVKGIEDRVQAHEAVGFSHGKVVAGTDPSPAYRMALMGAVTVARRTAIQLFGPVFGGISARDSEMLIQQIRAEQRRAQENRAKAEQRAIEDEAELRSLEELAKRGPVAVDPALRSGDPEAGKAVPVKAKSSIRVAKRPKAEKPTAKPVAAKRFKIHGPDGALQGAVGDPEIFAKEIVAMIKAASDEAEIDAVLQANNQTCELLLEAEGGTLGRFVDVIMEADETRRAAIIAKREREEMAKQKKVEQARRRAERKAAKTKAKGKASDEATDKASGKSSGKRGTKANAETAQETPDAASKPTAVAVPDLGGFGPMPRPEGPASPSATDAAKTPAEAGATDSTAAGEAAWSVPTIQPEIDANGQIRNLQAYGTALLEAIRSAPSEADIDAVFDAHATGLQAAPEATRRFLNTTADQRRKTLAG